MSHNCDFDQLYIQCMANRSAIYLATFQYLKCKKDCNDLLVLKNISNDIKIKVMLRKATACLQIWKDSKNINILNEALEMLPSLETECHNHTIVTTLEKLSMNV